MLEDRDTALLGRFWTLHAAVLKRDGVQERLRAGVLDQDLLDRSLAAAEDVLCARAALYRHLMDQGWRAPDVVVEDLAFDEVLLASTGGAVRA